MILPPSGNLGMGFCPLGLSLFGFGVPATSGTVTGYTLEKNPDGPSGDARHIDVYTRDYIVNENGLLQGQSAIAQQVFFDASTYNSQMSAIVQQALAGLIKQGVVSLVGVQANLNSNGVAGNVTINWVDNTTNQLNQTSV